jgi:hypothetical protein
MDCVEWGTVSLMNKNNPFSGLNFNLFLMTNTHWPNAKSSGTRYLFLSKAGPSLQKEDLSQIMGSR